MSFTQKNPIFTTQGYSLSQPFSGYIVADSLQKPSFKPLELLDRNKESSSRDFREKHSILFHADKKKALARAYGLYMSRLIHSKILRMDHAFEMLCSMRLGDSINYTQIQDLFKNESNAFKTYQKICELVGCIVPDFNFTTDRIFLNEGRSINTYIFTPPFQHLLGLPALKKMLFEDYKTANYDEYILDSILDFVYCGSKDFRSWFEMGQTLENPKPFFDTSCLTRPYLERTKKVLENTGNVYLQIPYLSEDEAVLEVVSEPHFNLKRDPLQIIFKNTPYSSSFFEVIEQVNDAFYCYGEIDHQETKTQVLLTENEMLYEVWAGFEKVDYSDLTSFGPIGVFETN